MILAIDCDGTIFKHRYPRLGEPIPGALDWLKRYQALGAKLILLTMRSDKELDDAVKACGEHGVEFWGRNENPEQKRWTNSPKVYAHRYIDDAAVGCPVLPDGDRVMVDWSLVGPLVEAELLKAGGR